MAAVLSHVDMAQEQPLEQSHCVDRVSAVPAGAPAGRAMGLSAVVLLFLH